MTSAVLRGREHTLVGGLAVIAEGRAGIALSRGGAPKRYRHKDPNEDAAAFACSESGVMLAVADGHWGCDAAELVVQRLVDRFAPEWIGTGAPPLAPRWPAAASDAITTLNESIHLELAAGSLEWPRTTLALAVLRPDEDLLAYASVGDSLIFRVAPDGAREIDAHGEGRSSFLGDSMEKLGNRWRAGSESLTGVRAVALASDGLSESGVGVADPAATVAACSDRAANAAPDLRSLEVTRGIAEQALAAQHQQKAGDNMACAVFWID